VSVHRRLTTNGWCPYGCNNFGVAFSDKLLCKDTQGVRDIVSRILANDYLVALEFVEKSLVMVERKVSTASLNGLGIVEDRSFVVMLAAASTNSRSCEALGSPPDGVPVVPLDLTALAAFVAAVRSCIEEIDRVSCSLSILYYMYPNF
jgi:hypothetical protein